MMPVFVSDKERENKKKIMLDDSFVLCVSAGKDCSRSKQCKQSVLLG